MSLVGVSLARLAASAVFSRAKLLYGKEDLPPASPSE
jgi:hypothetical protein